MMKRLWIATLALSLLAGRALADDGRYPSHPVKVLVPFTAGTNADFVARLFAQKLTERLKQPFVVENKGGAGGVLASQALLAAPADGYTIMLVSSAHAANPSLNAHLPYDTEKAFSGVALLGESPVVIAVHPSAHVKTLPQLIDLAKKSDVSYSSPGVGSASHFACEFLRAQAGVKMQNIPFKGSEYVTELLSGRVQFACPPIGLVAEYIKNGQLVPVAVSSVKRVPSLPGVPTAIEQGFPKYDYTIWYGMVASSKTPRPVLDKLAAELSAIEKTPEVVEMLQKQGISPRDMETARFDAFIKSEIVKLHEVAQASGVKPQ
jgi:tripartite-type tricarboxylate transporter receptor subunit TctC